MLRNFALLFLIGLVICQGLSAQNRDTSLVKMESNPFFFNVSKSPEGDIYVGTSKGIFRIGEKDLEKIDERVGYIGFDANGKLSIEKDGIKNYVERKFLHLLPFPDQSREEFHVGQEDRFYIVSNGILYSYEIVPYKLTFSNSSVRTISPNFVGTYSGIFYRNQKLTSPTFSDGYIREFDGKAFICYNDLTIRYLPKNNESLNEADEIRYGFQSQVEDVFHSSLDNSY